MISDSAAKDAAQRIVGALMPNASDADRRFTERLVASVIVLSAVNDERAQLAAKPGLRLVNELGRGK